MAITLTALAEIIGGRLINAVDPEMEIRNIGLDSSTLSQKAALFAAVPGTRKHGAVFAAQDRAAGAVAVLTDEAGAEILEEAGDQRPLLVVSDIREVLGVASSSVYGDPSQELVLIGVTGTSGKTTTSYLLEQGLMEAGYKVGLIGTTGTRIDGEAVPTKLTTPEAPTLQKLFSRMRQHQVTHVVMEVSSHALSLGRVSGSHFDVAAFTNLSQDHLDFHDTMEEYFDAKAMFFHPDSPLAATKQVVCVDDEWGVRMAEIAGNAQTVATTGKSADFLATATQVSESGAQRFHVTTPEDNDIPVTLALPGAFNVANATLALAAAVRAGVDPVPFVRGMAKVAVPGRMERIDEGQDFLAVVDYAHKPAQWRQFWTPCVPRSMADSVWSSVLVVIVMPRSGPPWVSCPHSALIWSSSLMTTPVPRFQPPSVQQSWQAPPRVQPRLNGMLMSVKSVTVPRPSAR